MCVCVCNIYLIAFILSCTIPRLTVLLPFSTSLFRLYYTLTPILPLLYTDFYPSCIYACYSRNPALYPEHCASSAITSPSFSFSHWQIHKSLSQGLWRSRLLDLTIGSDILARTKSQNVDYSHFILKLISVANLPCAAKAFTPVILSAEYTIGVK